MNVVSLLVIACIIYARRDVRTTCFVLFKRLIVTGGFSYMVKLRNLTRRHTILIRPIFYVYDLTRFILELMIKLILVSENSRLSKHI